MIIQIALGILLGYFLINYWEEILSLGLWLVVIAVSLILIIGGGIFLYDQLGAIAKFLLGLLAATLMFIPFLGLMALLGYFAHFSSHLTRLLKLGDRPILSNEKNKFLQYKEVILDYTSSGARVLLLILAIGFLTLIILLIILSLIY